MLIQRISTLTPAPTTNASRVRAPLKNFRGNDLLQLGLDPFDHNLHGLSLLYRHAPPARGALGVHLHAPPAEPLEPHLPPLPGAPGGHDGVLEARGLGLGAAVGGQSLEGQAAGLLVAGGSGLVLPPGQVARLFVFYCGGGCGVLYGGEGGEGQNVSVRAGG